jgi:hypothetical protein
MKGRNIHAWIIYVSKRFTSGDQDQFNAPTVSFLLTSSFRTTDHIYQDQHILNFVIYLCQGVYAWIATSGHRSHACVLNIPADI